MMACCFGTAAAVASFFIYIFVSSYIGLSRRFAIMRLPLPNFFQIQQLSVFVAFIICQKERLTDLPFPAHFVESYTRDWAEHSLLYVKKRRKITHLETQKHSYFFGILFFLSGIKLSDFFL